MNKDVELVGFAAKQINIAPKGQPKEKEQERPKEEKQKTPEPASHKQEATDQFSKGESKESRKSMSRDELIAGRMPANELFALPVFKVNLYSLKIIFDVCHRAVYKANLGLENVHYSRKEEML
jgi:hypothetical protein